MQLPVDVMLNVTLNAVAICFPYIVKEASPTRLEMGKLDRPLVISLCCTVECSAEHSEGIILCMFYQTLLLP